MRHACIEALLITAVFKLILSILSRRHAMTTHGDADRAAKRQRRITEISTALGDVSLSRSSLRKVLNSLGPEYETSRRCAADAADSRYKEVAASHVFSDGTRWDFCDPGRLLQHMVAESASLQQAYASAAAKVGDGTWRCLVSFDEFQPGNKLAGNPRRKSMSLIFNFEDLGRTVLAQPATWMYPVCLRTKLIKSVEGQWSQCLAVFLERMFLGANGLATAGVPLNLNGRLYLLKAKLSGLGSDGQGLQQALSWRGATSLRPCFFHHNVVKKNSNLCQHSSSLVEITCADATKFLAQSEEKLSDDLALVQAAAERRAMQTITKDMFDKICQSTGFNYQRQSLMWNARVRNMVKLHVISVDWVHTLLCDGAFSTELLLLLRESDRLAGIGFTEVEAFLNLPWKFPRSTHRHMRNLHQIFSDLREDYAENHSKIKALASELLSCYGLLRYFVQSQLPEDILEAQTQSFNLCCEIIDICVAAKHGWKSLSESGRLLEQACSAFLARHVEIYGTDYVKPKHHWIFDLADNWRAKAANGSHIVQDAFSIEKAHLRAKAIADRTSNTTQYEISVLSGTLHHQVESLKNMGNQAELLGPSAPCPGFPQARIADDVLVDGLHVSVDDIVQMGTVSGEVLACMQEGADLFLMVELLQLRTMESKQTGTYSRTGQRRVWPAEAANLVSFPPFPQRAQTCYMHGACT